MPTTTPAALTVGEISKRLNVALHRVEYVIKSRDIKPVSVAGVARIFRESDVDFIAAELRRIDEEREGQ